MYKEFINVSFNYQSMIGPYLFNIKNTKTKKRERKKGKKSAKFFDISSNPFNLNPRTEGLPRPFLFCFGPSALIIKMDQENNDFG